MEIYGNVRFLTGIIAVYLIVFLGVITGTYYGTRLPVGTLTQYSTLAQVQWQHRSTE